LSLPLEPSLVPHFSIAGFKISRSKLDLPLPVAHHAYKEATNEVFPRGSFLPGVFEERHEDPIKLVIIEQPGGVQMLSAYKYFSHKEVEAYLPC
jgi:hypothetical protein